MFKRVKIIFDVDRWSLFDNLGSEERVGSSGCGRCLNKVTSDANNGLFDDD